MSHFKFYSAESLDDEDIDSCGCGEEHEHD
ncbi:hypothetical protein BA71_03000 [Acinetobacter baumannii LAC-4]|nr:hypothetical protein BA71_03000 [Acinetobacter baumannii LAC-4]